MQVYIRLQKLGICLSHTATILAVKRMGLNHDKSIKNWASHLSEVPRLNPPIALENESTSSEDDGDNEVVPNARDDADLPVDKTISIIGDNFDTSIRPRDMRIDHQVKSLHLFHSVAIVSQIKTLHLDDRTAIGDLCEVPVSAFLPSIADCTAVRDNFVILAARILVDNLACFSSLSNCVPRHIQHKFSPFMKERTVSVSLCL